MILIINKFRARYLVRKKKESKVAEGKTFPLTHF